LHCAMPTQTDSSRTKFGAKFDLQPVIVTAISFKFGNAHNTS
jgi:hypothetical protein